MRGSSMLLHLPEDVLLLILGQLEARSLASALCTCTTLGGLREQAWRAACFNRWPEWAAIAAEPGAQWRRQYELLSLRSSELEALCSPAAVRKQQKVVTERHRSILAEWLAEVSFDWQLDSVIVYKAVAYLDHYLSHHPVEQLSRFQLLGLACLRAAMGDARAAHPAALDDTDKRLDPQNFAYISDDTYTAEEVEEQTQVVEALIPAHLKAAPNAKMFLRSFWYRATLKGVVHQDEMHVYTLASFLLQLALLDLECSGYTPSRLAASALSLALAAFHKPAWPLALQRFGSYLDDDLAPCVARLEEMQAKQPAEQLRPIWRSMHEQHSYPEYDAEWRRAVLIFSCASRAHLAPASMAAAAAAADCAEGEGAAAAAPAAAAAAAPGSVRGRSPQPPAPAAPLDATAMLTD